jgi:hypothetical protein
MVPYFQRGRNAIVRQPEVTKSTEPTTNIVYYAELSTLSNPDCPERSFTLVIQVNARPLNPT